MKKSLKLYLALLLIGGFALTFSSCKDSENVNDIPTTPEEIAQSKETEKAEALLSILSFTAGLDSLPDNWFANDYTVEPSVGVVNDASTPYVRYIPVLDKDEAITKYNSFSGKLISKDATSDSRTIEGVGSLNFQVLDQSDVIATIDFNIKQQPHLTQIRFVPVSAMGSNATLKGDPYYTFGDIVSTQEGKTQKKTYWICVRPCSRVQGKGTSHWMSFQLNDWNSKKEEGVNSDNVNIKKLTASKKNDYFLPTQLGNESGSLEHLQNLFKLLSVLDKPTKYENETFDNGIGGINRDELSQTKVERISNHWNTDNIWDKVLPPGVKRNSLRTCFDQDNEINVFYYGHKKSPAVFLAKLTGDELKLDQQGELEWTRGTEKVDFRDFYNHGVMNLETPIKGMPTKGFIVRYKTGGQMKGDWTTWCDDEAPLESFSVKHPEITDEYVFNKRNETADMGASVMGDVIENHDDESVYGGEPAYNEICVLNNSSKAPEAWNNNSYFFQYQPEGSSRVVMQDKAISLNAYMHLLNTIMFNFVKHQNATIESQNKNNDTNYKKIDTEKLPKCSDTYQEGLRNLYEQLQATVESIDLIKEDDVEELVDMIAADNNGTHLSTFEELHNLDQISILIAYTDYENKTGSFNTARLTYTFSTGKYTLTNIKRNVTTMNGHGFLNLKSYPDIETTKPTIGVKQAFVKTIIEDRKKVKEESVNFLNSHKVE